MKIVSPHLPWTIIAVAAPGNQAFVTVGDVLDAIYHALRTSITSEEFHMLPTERDRRRASSAYEERYRRIHTVREYEDEKRRGVRRVDFLMGHTRFMGLSLRSAGTDAWIMNTT